ncbi:MAG: DUF1573 domain-containing protein [Saprospiraceae bacterium]
MKNISQFFYDLLFFSALLFIASACKKESWHPSNPSDPDYVSKGTIADLAYNPVRRDGTIDSSYLPILKWDEVVYDFGTIQQGEMVERKYAFKNIGTAPLVILNATSTCGCTIPEWPKNHILPDSTAYVIVRFNSKYKDGAQNKEVTIFANTLPNRSMINIKGMVEKPK